MYNNYVLVAFWPLRSKETVCQYLPYGTVQIERDLCHYLDTVPVWLKLPKAHPRTHPVTRLQSFVGGIHGMRMNVIKTLQPQFHATTIPYKDATNQLWHSTRAIYWLSSAVCLRPSGHWAHSCMCHNYYLLYMFDSRTNNCVYYWIKTLIH